MEVEKDRLSSVEVEINGVGWVLWVWVTVVSWAQRWWVDLDFWPLVGFEGGESVVDFLGLLLCLVEF